MELQQLQMACEELEHDYRPAITFLVVQKRHHARFFPQEEKDKVYLQSTCSSLSLCKCYFVPVHVYVYAWIDIHYTSTV